MKLRKQGLIALTICLSVLFSRSPSVFGGGLSLAKTGFLVVAPDRGFLGNQEVQALFNEFNKDYPAALARVGRDYNGLESEHSVYLRRAVDELKKAVVTEIVAIPLFLSSADPILRKVTPHLASYASGETIRWAASMRESHLTAQILLDRVDRLSRDPESERLIVIGVGAMDEEGEKTLRADLESIVRYVKRYRTFKETSVGVYYERDAEKGLKEKKNKEVDDLIVRTAAKKGRTILIPFFIGPKFDSHMSLTRWLGDKVKELDVVYDGEEIVPHPNLLLWLKKSANAYLPASPKEIGVVIMPHGATQPWNDAVEEAIAPLKTRYRIEMAYGMGDPETIRQAVSRLEDQGVRRIIFIRMYALSDQLKEETDYILGLSDAPPGHDHGGAPPQVRSAALFTTFGGYEEDPALAEILHDRIMEVSRDPARETVILVAHGAGDDEADARWLSVMNRHVERLRKDTHCGKLQALLAATVREDWPEKREKAVAQLKEQIEEAKRQGTVLLISHRLRGAGPYRALLEGVGIKNKEDYEINGRGFVPHPAITRWLEKGIEREMTAMSGRMLPTAPASAAGEISPKG